MNVLQQTIGAVAAIIVTMFLARSDTRERHRRDAMEDRRAALRQRAMLHNAFAHVSQAATAAVDQLPRGPAVGYQDLGRLKEASEALGQFPLQQLEHPRAIELLVISRLALSQILLRLPYGPPGGDEITGLRIQELVDAESELRKILGEPADF